MIVDSIRKYVPSIVGILVFLVVSQLVRSYFKPERGPSHSSSSQYDAVSMRLKERAAEYSRSLPIQVDEYTTLVSVDIIGTRIIYRNVIGLTLEEVDLNSPETQIAVEEIKSGIRDNICAIPEIIFDMKYGVRYSYDYVSSDSQHLWVFDFGGSDCE